MDYQDRSGCSETDAGRLRLPLSTKLNALALFSVPLLLGTRDHTLSVRFVKLRRRSVAQQFSDCELDGIFKLLEGRLGGPSTIFSRVSVPPLNDNSPTSTHISDVGQQALKRLRTTGVELHLNR
jgi:hypothetical protein